MQAVVKCESIARPYIRYSDSVKREENSDFLASSYRARENKPLASTIKMLILSCKGILLSSCLFRHKKETRKLWKNFISKDQYSFLCVCTSTFIYIQS